MAQTLPETALDYSNATVSRFQGAVSGSVSARLSVPDPTQRSLKHVLEVVLGWDEYLKLEGAQSAVRGYVSRAINKDDGLWRMQEVVHMKERLKEMELPSEEENDNLIVICRGRKFYDGRPGFWLSYGDRQPCCVLGTDLRSSLQPFLDSSYDMDSGIPTYHAITAGRKFTETMPQSKEVSIAKDLITEGKGVLLGLVSKATPVEKDDEYWNCYFALQVGKLAVLLENGFVGCHLTSWSFKAHDVVLTFQKTAELNGIAEKHVKRGDLANLAYVGILFKPPTRFEQHKYGCIYDCTATFENIQVWRRHISEHQKEEREHWRCDEPSLKDRDLPCAKLFWKAQTAEDHLAQHYSANEKDLEIRIEHQRIGARGYGSGWCGFCREIIQLKQEVGPPMAMKEHIEGHLARGDVVEMWIPEGKHLPIILDASVDYELDEGRLARAVWAGKS